MRADRLCNSEVPNSAILVNYVQIKSYLNNLNEIYINDISIHRVDNYRYS